MRPSLNASQALQANGRSSALVNLVSSRCLFVVAAVAAALMVLAADPAEAQTGSYPVPPEAEAVDTSNPDRVIGNGTPQSCTSAAVVAAVAQGGVIIFDCGPNPVTITMAQTAKIFNNTGPEIVIDGGGLVTLSGGGVRRILYMNTCDQALVWTTSHCQDQDHPRLTVQNLRFVDGNSTGATEGLEGGGGGGAIFVRGGRFKVVNSQFVGNRCDPTGPDVGGAALRVFSQSQNLPVYVVNSTFEGGVCSNGSGISSIGVSWTIINSVFTNNQAIGRGANPQRGGTPGGGSGGAIYLDGNTFTLRLLGSRIENNHANEGGGAIFFVSNNNTGTLVIEDSVLRYNPSDGFETSGFPGIFVQGAGTPTVINSVISNEQDVPDICPSNRDCDRVMFQDSGGRWHRWETISAPRVTSSFYFGNPGDVAFAGDWNCDGVDTPGLYRQSDGFVYLRNSNTQGVADIQFFFATRVTFRWRATSTATAATRSRSIDHPNRGSTSSTISARATEGSALPTTHSCSATRATSPLSATSMAMGSTPWACIGSPRAWCTSATRIRPASLTPNSSLAIQATGSSPATGSAPVGTRWLSTAPRHRRSTSDTPTVPATPMSSSMRAASPESPLPADPGFLAPATSKGPFRSAARMPRPVGLSQSLRSR